MENIYIVENNQIIMLDLIKILKRRKYNVVGNSGDGRIAINEIVKLKPNIVLLNVNQLDNIDGISVAETVIKHCPDINIIFISSSVRNEIMKKIKKIPYKGMLHKPFDEKSLIETLVMC